MLLLCLLFIKTEVFNSHWDPSTFQKHSRFCPWKHKRLEVSHASCHQLYPMCSFHLCNHFWATLTTRWHESQYKRSNWNNKQNMTLAFYYFPKTKRSTSSKGDNKRTLGFIHKTSNLCSKQYMNSRFSHFQNLSG